MTGLLEYPLELALLGATLPSRIRQGWKQKTRKKGYFRKQELERGMETGAWRSGGLLQQESFCTDPPSSNTQTYNCGEHSKHMLGYRQLYRVSLSQQVQEQWTWGLLGPDSLVEISQGLNTCRTWPEHRAEKPRRPEAALPFARIWWRPSRQSGQLSPYSCKRLSISVPILWVQYCGENAALNLRTMKGFSYTENLANSSLLKLYNWYLKFTVNSLDLTDYSFLT